MIIFFSVEKLKRCGSNVLISFSFYIIFFLSKHDYISQAAVFFSRCSLAIENMCRVLTQINI